jgi:lysophospholipase L1-like esterase
MQNALSRSVIRIGIGLLAVILPAMAFQKPAPRKLHIFMAGDSTMSIKDTKAYPETGWGMPFVFFWDSTVQVVNRAKNGRSTKTFISEGLWQQILDKGTAGDYVFIQFGHNDEVPTKVNTYTTPEEFTANLKRYIAEVRGKQMKPVLLTPVARRKFNAAGNLEDTHAQYSNLVRKVAAEERVSFIDADKLSQAMYSQMGVEQSKLLFLHLQPGEHPNYPQGKEDNTHFSEWGARMIAQMVLKELRVAAPELATHIVSPAKK